MRSPPVPRGIRVVNVVALLLFLAGAGLYVRAWFGMHGLRTSEESAASGPFAGMAIWNRYLELSQLGIWLVMTAVAVAVLAAVATLVVRRRPGR